MEKEPTRREQKRESARKARERAIYTKKAVRIKEERAEKRRANGDYTRNHLRDGPGTP